MVASVALLAISAEKFAKLRQSEMINNMGGLMWNSGLLFPIVVLLYESI